MSLLAPKSSSGTAGSTAAAINSDFSCRYGVVIAVQSTEAAGIEVIGKDDTAGVLLDAGKEAFFPCINLNEILIKRQGGSDITYTFYAR